MSSSFSATTNTEYSLAFQVRSLQRKELWKLEKYTINSYVMQWVMPQLKLHLFRYFSQLENADRFLCNFSWKRQKFALSMK